MDNETLERMIETMTHFRYGGEIEYDHRNSLEAWKDCDSPTWDWWNYNYRIKRYKPSVNWDQVRDEYNYLAQDADGTMWLFKKKPLICKHQGGWYVDFQDISADNLGSAIPGTGDWQDSLVRRPD